MAHTCPVCGQYCTCGGDWDDIDMGYDPDCTHCDLDDIEGAETDDDDDYIGMDDI
jgi:hypothetical protein